MHLDPLMEGAREERTCLWTRPHWFSVLRHGIGGVALLATGTLLMLFGGPLYHLLESWLPDRLTLRDGRPAGPSSVPSPGPELSVTPALTWVAAILVLLGSAVLGWALLERRFTEYAITVSPRFGGRIVKVQGILSRQTVAVPLSMVNDLVLHEPLLGRLLRWGHIDLETGNDYAGDRLLFMPNPRAFYEIWAALLATGYGDRGGSSLSPQRVAARSRNK